MKKIICTLLIALILAGCKSVNSSSIQTRAIQPAEIHDDVENFESATITTEQRAQNIADHITKMDGIERTSVVITGNTAIVGIEITGELEDRKLMKLKTEVEKEVRRMDKELKHVAVTAAAELVQRITNIADSVTVDEEPPSTSPEMREIIQKLTPPM